MTSNAMFFLLSHLFPVQISPQRIQQHRRIAPELKSQLTSSPVHTGAPYYSGGPPKVTPGPAKSYPTIPILTDFTLPDCKSQTGTWKWACHLTQVAICFQDHWHFKCSLVIPVYWGRGPPDLLSQPSSSPPQAFSGPQLSLSQTQPHSLVCVPPRSQAARWNCQIGEFGPRTLLSESSGAELTVCHFFKTRNRHI